MRKKRIKRIAVLTSGGDAPGMNAAIRAVTRTAIHENMKVFGVRQGYAGLIAGDFLPLGPRDVGGIIHLGGTILRSARSREFKTEAGRNKALAALQAKKIDAAIIIGGNGSQTGAYALSQLGLPVVGIASTIDNDLAGSEITIGVDTAMNIALEAIDRLKTTAASHKRAFLVEVMGRDCGYLALVAGISGGAEVIAVPEAPCRPEDIARELKEAYERGKSHGICVIAEGAEFKAADIASYFREHHERIGFELRLTALGHVQRGGAPGVFDRFLATRLGAAAVEALVRGEENVLTGLMKGAIVTTPLSEVVRAKKTLDTDLLRMAHILSR